jgi:hypothetical protein
MLTVEINGKFVRGYAGPHSWVMALLAFDIFQRRGC